MDRFGPYVTKAKQKASIPSKMLRFATVQSARWSLMILKKSGFVQVIQSRGKKSAEVKGLVWLWSRSWLLGLLNAWYFFEPVEKGGAGLILEIILASARILGGCVVKNLKRV